MAKINVKNVTFYYEGSFDNIFDNVTFSIDSNWKLGFLGRNGKGKTTFLQLLMGKYEYRGSIQTSIRFDAFPYQLTNEQLVQPAIDWLNEIKSDCQEWKVLSELDKLNAPAEILYRSFQTLSHGERTKLMLAILFSNENEFLLIDEPTNHLDQEAREVVKTYLNKKKSFILVSHDRDLLDACIDHVLVLNRKTIELQAGNFTDWWENKIKKDQFSQMEHEKHQHEIERLKQSVLQSQKWAVKSENSKIGFDPIKDHDRSKGARAYIGAKSEKMQRKVKQYEKRIENEIKEKEDLLFDIERPIDLKLMPLLHHKETLIKASDFSFSYDEHEWILNQFDFALQKKERVFLKGKNGCGKSTFIKLILQTLDKQTNQDLNEDNLLSTSHIKGDLTVASGLKISYVNQDTSFLRGDLKTFCMKNHLDESLFFALLRQLDMERVQFIKQLQDFSEGQKKKVLLAASLMTPAHVYVWDEPLNYIDVFSRMQIENVLLKYEPTMILVDHDVRFQQKIATKIIEM